MTVKVDMKYMMMLTLLAVLPMTVDAALSVSRGTLIRRSYGPVSLSGITYAGGDDYYAVADNGSVCGLYKVTVKLSSDGKSISSYSVGAKRSLAMAADIEGVAYDPGSGKVWVSDESNQTITEYDPTDGTVCRRVDIPPVLKKIVRNYGFESLTISGDGLTMWTANEEALTCDGDRSSYSAGTTVRLVKFTRETVADDWKLVAMYPYTTDKWTYRYSYGTAGRRGVSDLCALPDGSLLVLERELSSDSAGTGWSAAFGVTLFYSINRVTPAAMAAATDVKDANNGLKAMSGWKAVSKITLLRSTEDTTYWSNVEGICLGPRLATGGCELMTLTDAGDGDTNPQLIPHVMSGLSIRTLDFPSPEVGISTMVGSTYRYLDGTAVQVDLSGTTEDKPYIVDGAPYAVCDGWSASGQTPAEGAGLSASFRVAADGKFVWNVRKESAATGYHVVDSFEGLAVGTQAGSMTGWSGEDCAVEAATYVPPTPPGYVMTQETHTKVLDATEDEAIRTLPTQMSGDDKIDVMVCVRRSASELKSLPDDIQTRVASDPRGRLCMWHLYEENGVWKRGWIPLSETTYEDEEWVRIGIELDYTSNSSGDAFAKVTVNGSCQPTAHGVRSPTDLRAYGPWHYLAKNRRTGGVSMPSEISFAGTKVDDLMLCKKTVAPEHTGATSVDGIEFAWFDNMGLPRNPTAAAPFIPGYTLGDVYAAGLDPYSNRPLEVTGFELDASGRPHIEINGYKGETPVGYRVLYSPTPDFKNATMLGTSDGAFDGDAASWSTTWDGKAEVGRETGFYKIEAFR